MHGCPLGGGVGSERRYDRVHLLFNALCKDASVSAADVDLVVAPPDRAHLAPDDLALVRLRVDDPHAGRRDEDVIDVAAGPGDEAVVERDDPVTDLPRDECGEPALPVASLSPRRSGVAFGHLLGHGGGVIAVSTADVVVPLLLSSLALGGRRCSAEAGRRRRIGRRTCEAGRLLRRTVPVGLGTLRQGDATGRADGRVFEPQAARAAVVSSSCHGRSMAANAIVVDAGSAGVDSPTRAVRINPIEVVMLRRQPQRTSVGDVGAPGIEPGTSRV